MDSLGVKEVDFQQFTANRVPPNCRLRYRGAHITSHPIILSSFGSRSSLVARRPSENVFPVNK